MKRRAYGFIDWSREAVYQPKPKKPPLPPTVGTDPQGDLLAPVVPAAGAAHPATSNDGIHDVLPRAGSQQYKLLLAYGSRPMGLTAEEAADIAGLNVAGCCYWKRVGDLLRANLLEDTLTTRLASTGSEQRVLAITAKGKRVLK